MSNFTYQQIVDFLRESTGDNNWYLNNKIGQPVAHRYFQPLAVQRHVTEAVKKMKKMKDEEHAGDFAHKAKQSAAAGKTTFTIGGTTYPVKANPNVKEEAEQVEEANYTNIPSVVSNKVASGMTRAMHKAAAKRYEADADDAHKEGKTHKRDWANNMAKNHNQAAKEMESVKEEVELDELTGIKTDMGKATKFYRRITNRIKKKAKAGLDTTSNERSQQNASHAIANMYKEEKMAEAAKWRSHPDAYNVDDEGIKTPRNPNNPKFRYDTLQHRADTANDAKTARGKKSALKTSLKKAKGQHGPEGVLPEQGVAEGLKYNTHDPFQDSNRRFKRRELEHELAHEDEWNRRTNYGRNVHHHDNTPHDVHIDGKKWKTFGSAAHAHNVANKLSISGKKASVHKTPDVVEQVDEVLNPSMGAEKYIHDFVHSDNPKFGGKSKKERIRMALGAYYHAKKNIQEYTEHTHAVHFENGKGEWEGMAFIHAKDDEDAKEQAHHMANSVKWAHLKMSHLEKHTPIVEEGVVSNEDELINVLAETFGLDEATKEQKLAARAARNARMAGNISAARSKMSVKLQRRVGIAPEKSVASTKVSHQAKSVAAAKSASHPENHDESPVAKMRKINQARQDAYYAKGGREGFGSGGGTKNSSPLERAMTAVKEKPVKGAGASPAELDAELKAKKKPVAEAYLSEKKMKKEELNTDMLDGHENDKSSKKKAKIVKKASKLKRKYMGKNKGRTATGEKAHVIETEVTLDDAKT